MHDVAAAKRLCAGAFHANIPRINHFARRLADLRLSPRDVVIVIANVDDIPYGRSVAENTVPGFPWQAYRDIGLTPFARSLANREATWQLLMHVDNGAARKLLDLGMAVLAVVVFNYGVAEVFSAHAHDA